MACLFPGAAVTKCHKLGGLKQQEFILWQCWSPEGQPAPRGWRVCAALEAPGESLLHAFLLAPAGVSSSWQSLACTCACRSSPFLFRRVVFSCESLCLFSSYKGLFIEVRAPPIESDLTSAWWRLPRTYFHIRSQSQVLGWGLPHLLEGHSSTHNLGSTHLNLQRILLWQFYIAKNPQIKPWWCHTAVLTTELSRLVLASSGSPLLECDLNWDEFILTY